MSKTLLFSYSEATVFSRDARWENSAALGEVARERIEYAQKLHPGHPHLAQVVDSDTQRVVSPVCTDIPGIKAHQKKLVYPVGDLVFSDEKLRFLPLEEDI